MKTNQAFYSGQKREKLFLEDEISRRGWSHLDMLPCWKQLVNQSIKERKIAIFVRGINTVLIVCADKCWWKLLTLPNYLKTCLQNSNWRRKFSYCIPTFLDIVEWIFLLFHWHQKTIAAFSHETKKIVDIAS